MKTKTIILILITTAASFFNWLILKQALYSKVLFDLNNSRQFWKWFLIRLGLPFLAMGIFCSVLILFLIAIKSRIIVGIMGILASLAFLLVFFSNYKYALIICFVSAFIFVIALIAADGIIHREQAEQVNFKVKPLVKRGLPPIIFALMVLLSSAYYFSPLPRSVTELKIPDDLIDKVIKVMGNFSDSKGADAAKVQAQDAQGLIDDYFAKNMPEYEGVVDNNIIQDALKGISNGKDSVLNSINTAPVFEEVKSGVNHQIEEIFRPYYKYLPISLTISFFFLLKLISAEFSFVVAFFTSLLVNLCFALRIFDKEVMMVEKEKVVF